MAVLGTQPYKSLHLAEIIVHPLRPCVCSAQTLLTCAQQYNNSILTGEMVLFRPAASSSFLGALWPWLHLLIKVGPVILTIINVHNIADNNTKFIICDR